MKKIKHYIYTKIVHYIYLYWINLRNKSIDEYGEKLCYCKHTYKCTCNLHNLKSVKKSA